MPTADHELIDAGGFELTTEDGNDPFEQQVGAVRQRAEGLEAGTRR